jgi:sugar transferase (PEP-CTERM/EpsH1 system associated)
MPDLLYLTHRMPYPPNKGDKIRSYHMLKYLSRHFRVHLGCFIDDADDLRHIDAVRALCVDTCFIQRGGATARLRSLRGLVTGQALSLPYFQDSQLQTWVDHVLASQPIARALVFSAPMAQYLPASGTAAAPRALVDLVDVDSEKWLQYSAAARWPLSLLYRREAQRLLAWERAVCQRSDGVTFVSEAEAALFRRRAPEAAGKPDYFHNGVDAAYFSPHHAHATPYDDGATVLVFTGAMDYRPNIDAVDWFARSVVPLLRRHFPALLFYIVGRGPSAGVRRLASLPGVVVTGAVPDVRPYLQHAVMAVAPLRIARGVQNKVLEAMAMQKLVVASPEALEGIRAQPGVDVLLAGDADGFVRQISLQLKGRANRSIGHAARQRVLQDYCWDKNLARLGAMLGLAAPAGPALPQPLMQPVLQAVMPPLPSGWPPALAAERHA